MTEAASAGARAANPMQVLDHLMASGALLPAQLPAPSRWSPERRLAAAVLASALVEIRDHHADPQYRRSVLEDLKWIAANDRAWAFSFVRLCELFQLEPSWVRAVVSRWMAAPTPAHGAGSVLAQVAAGTADGARGPARELDRAAAVCNPCSAPRRTTFAAMA